MYTQKNGVLPTVKPINKPKSEELQKALKFCDIFASKISNNNHDLKEELVQEGICAFLEAYKNFDPSMGYSSISYTSHYMKGHILRAWNKYKLPVNVPFNSENYRAISNLSKESNDDLENQKKNQIRAIMQSKSIDDLNDNIFHTNPFLSNHSFEDEIELKDLKARVKKEFNLLKKSLDQCELEILEKRIYGNCSLKELAKKYKFSMEGIRKKEARILKMIKLKFKDGKNEHKTG